MTIGHSAAEINQFTPQLASDLGLFRKYGIENAQVSFLDGDTKVIQAMFAGQIDVGVVASGPVLSSQLTDVPLITTALYMTKATDLLVSSPNIRGADALKGKPVAISSLGGGTHTSAVLSLSEIGLTDEDVVLQNIGGQAQRIAALKAGSVGAAIVDYVLENEMKAQGFNVLARLPDSPREVARAGIVMRRDWLESNPNTALAVVAANLEAMQALFNQTDRAVDGFARWSQIADRSVAESTVKSFLTVARRDMRWSRDAWEIHKQILATQSPAMNDVDVTKAYTFQVLDKLRDLGFNDAVGVPRS